jgi:retron-type reverse transcriptase
MKRFNHLFDQVVSFENLLQSYRYAKKGTGTTFQTCQFFYHLENELINLQDELKNETYQPSPYKYFQIYDPKKRTIAVATFRDRVVHHAIVRVLTPIYEKIFIYDSYATRKNKGTHIAICRAQQFARRRSYYMKFDIEKFFDSVDHQILLNIVSRKIKDKKLMHLIEKIIRNIDNNKGLPVGNLTSQFFANVYLNAFDHFIKEEKRIKDYLRYMDDFVLFHDNPSVLKTLKLEIIDYLNEMLKLQINKKATMMHHTGHGLSYLGMRIYAGCIRVKRENRRRSIKRILKNIESWHAGECTEPYLCQSISSVVDHLKHFCPHINTWVPEP